MKLIEQIKEYQPYNEQEAMDRIMILEFLDKEKGAFHRENKAAHMTASAWVVNRERTKILMIHHNIYDSWSWMGGHADGEQDLLKVSVREVQEESGLKDVRPVREEIFSLEALTVDGHIKNGAYVSSHLHLNLTYLLEADEGDKLAIKADENSGVAWFSLDGAVRASSEPWFREHIYSKLNEKLNSIVDSTFRAK